MRSCRSYSMEKTFKAVNTRTVLQTEMTECGAACLSMILQYHGQYASLEEMRRETDVSRDGCSAGNIVRAADRRGLDCQGLEVDIDQLGGLEPPFILWWENNHFVVFEGIKNHRFLLNDPAFGKRDVSRDTMEKEFSGIVLTFRPGDGFREHVSYGKKPEGFFGSGRLLQMLRSSVPNAWTTIFSGIMSVAFAAAAAILIGIDRSPSLNNLVVFFIALFLAVLSSGVYLYFLSLWKDKFEIRGSWTYLRRLLQAPIAYLQDRYPEDLVGRTAHNDRVNRFAVGFVSTLAVGLFGLIVSVIFMFAASTRGLLAVLLGVCVSGTLRILFDRIQARDRVKAKVLESNLIRTAFTDIDSRDIIKKSGQAHEYIQRLKDARDVTENVRGRIRDRDRIRRGITYVVYCGAVLLSLNIYGAHMELNAVISWCMMGMIMIISGEKLIELFEIPGGMEEDINGGSLPEEAKHKEVKNTMGRSREYQKLRGNIRVKGVSFKYGTFGQPLFEDLSFDIAGGTFFVITGETGCGKSTLGKMLGGLIMPEEGEIRYDGRTITSISPKTIYASIAVVEQKPVLFPATIRENITLWNPNISEDEIEKAVKDACAEEFIAKRQTGLETRLGANGRGLSGGEQQRIEIARALAANPSILIMDEAFSAIDDETTLKIINNIRRRGCTCLLITGDDVLIREESKVLDLSVYGKDND